MAGKVEGKQAKSERERLRPKNAAIWSPLLLGLSGVSRRVVSVIYRHLVSSRHFLVKDIFGGILVAYRLGWFRFIGMHVHHLGVLLCIWPETFGNRSRKKPKVQGRLKDLF